MIDLYFDCLIGIIAVSLVIFLFLGALFAIAPFIVPVSIILFIKYMFQNEEDEK